MVLLDEPTESIAPVLAFRLCEILGNLKNLKSLLITNCPEILPEPKHKDMNTPEKVEEYQIFIRNLRKNT